MTTPSDTIARLRAAVAAGPTPGPWSQAHRPDSEGMFATEVFDANGKTIATFSWLPRPTVGGVTETYRGANAEWPGNNEGNRWHRKMSKATVSIIHKLSFEKAIADWNTRYVEPGTKD